MYFVTDRNRFLILLFVAGLAIKIPMAINISSFGVDESIYLATAKHFAETGKFGLSDTNYDFRFIAPLFPLILSIPYFFWGEPAALLVSPVFSSLTIVMLYFLGQRIGGDKIGRMTALVGFFSSVLFLIGSRPLTESIALFFFTASLVISHDVFYSKNKKNAQLALPPLFVLTFLTRFQYGFLLGIFLVALLAYEILKKNKLNVSWELAAGSLIAFSIFSPWAILNVSNYGTPLGGATHQAGTDTGFDISAAIFYVPYSFIVFGLFVPFVVYGKYLAYREKKTFLLICLGSVFISQFFVFGKIVEERYILPILPVVCVLSSIGFYGFRKIFGKIASFTMISIMIMSAVVGYGIYNLYLGNDRYEETRAAVIFMSQNCSSPVMSNSFSQVWYYSGFENIPLGSDIYKSLEKAGEKLVTCIMFSGYEAPFDDFFHNTPYVDNIFNIGKVSVYKLRT
jgi:4-amino-4-deoxy-L-arabinose transferase-like glycosyltransferase